MATRTRITVAVLALGLVALGLGCKDETTPIKTLLDDPSRYDHQTVRIAGEVQESVGILGYGGYRIDDGTGRLLVVTQGGGAPRTGARVGVEGEFRAAYTIGSESGAVLLEKRRSEP